jgi:hypothetical protein
MPHPLPTGLSRILKPGPGNDDVRITVSINISYPMRRYTSVLSKALGDGRHCEPVCRVVPENPVAIERDNVLSAIAIYVGCNDIVNLMIAMLINMRFPSGVWIGAEIPGILEPNLIEDDVNKAISIHVEYGGAQSLEKVVRMVDQVLNPHRIRLSLVPIE